MSDVKFTDQQRNAIDHAGAAMLVSAGAGSGKTQVLVARIANALITGIGGEVLGIDEILTITFTRKAASELKERVAKELRKRQRFDLATRIDEMWISTVHGMCSRILRAHALECGIDPSFKVLIENEGEPLRIEAFRKAIDMCGDEQADLFAAFSYKNLYEMVSGLYPYFVEGKPLEPYCDIAEGSTPVVSRYAEGLIVLTKCFFDLFTQAKAERNALDYDDLEQKTLALLEGNDSVRHAYQKKFKLVHVDEFQDTNEIQLRLERALAGSKLYTVGDAQQSIYRFRGADLDVYKEYRSDIEGQTEQLKDNFRSHSSILAFSNAIFRQAETFQLFDGMFLPLVHGRDEERAAKDFPYLEGLPRITIDLYKNAPTAKMRTLNSDGLRKVYAKKMAQQIKDLIDRGVDTGEIAILTSASTSMKIYLDALLDLNIDAVISGGGHFYSERTVGLFENFLRVLANPRDERALLLVLSSEMFRMSDNALYVLTRETHALRAKDEQHEAGDPQGAQQGGREYEGRATLYDVLVSEVDDPRLLGGEDLEDARLAVEVLEDSFSRLGSDDLSGVIIRAIEGSGLDLRYFGQGSPGKQQYAFILKLLRMVDDFERTVGTGPAGFAESLKQNRELNSKEGLSALPNEEKMPVRLMTIHSAKGLEFPVVFLPEIQSTIHGASSLIHVDESQTPHKVVLQLPDDEKSADGYRGSELFTELRDTENRAAFEEFARLLYVAVTRAREALYISGYPSATVVSKSSGRALGAPLFDAFVKGAMEFPEHEEGAHATRVFEIDIPEGEKVTCSMHSVDVACDIEHDEGASNGEAAQEKPTPLDTAMLGLGNDEPQRDEPLYPTRISYSGFSAYEECARRFEAERLLHVGELQLKEDREKAVAFGSAFHTLAEYFARVGTPPQERIHAVALYHDIADEQDVRRLSDALDVWTKSDTARRLFDGRSRPLPEIPFAIYLGEEGEGVLLDGSIDLMRTDEKTATIIDYKTGGTQSDTIEELEKRYCLQAECYALVPLRAGKKDIEVIFVRPEVLVDGEMQRVCFTFDQEDRGRIEADLLALFEKMKRGEYPPLPSYVQEVCGSCPIRGTICEVGKK